MSLMDPIFRPARLSDIAEIAPLIHMAGQVPKGGNLFEILFDLDKEEALNILKYLLAAKTPCWLHYSIFYIAEIDGKVGAISSAYLESEHGTGSMIAALTEYGWKKSNFASLRHVGILFDRVRPKVEDDSWIIECVASHPDHRRKGLIQILFHILLQKGKNRGLKIGQVSLFSDNTAAKKAYKKAGFGSEQTLKDSEFKELFRSEGFTTLFQPLIAT